jgi:hypothetical protein
MRIGFCRQSEKLNPYISPCSLQANIDSHNSASHDMTYLANKFFRSEKGTLLKTLSLLSFFHPSNHSSFPYLSLSIFIFFLFVSYHSSLLPCFRTTLPYFVLPFIYCFFFLRNLPLCLPFSLPIYLNILSCKETK